MHTPEELEKKLWKAIKSDRTLMLGLDGAEDGHSGSLEILLLGDGGAARTAWTAQSARAPHKKEACLRRPRADRHPGLRPGSPSPSIKTDSG